SYDNMASAYEALNRFEEAKSIAEEALTKKLDGPGIHFVLLDLAYYRQDHAAIQHELDAIKGTSFEPFLMFFNAEWNTQLGKVRTSRGLWQQTRKTLIGSGAKELANQLQAFAAYDEARLGYESEARQKAAQAVGLSNDPDTRWAAALVYAAAGDVGKSVPLLESAMRDAP